MPLGFPVNERKLKHMRMHPKFFGIRLHKFFPPFSQAKTKDRIEKLIILRECQIPVVEEKIP